MGEQCQGFPMEDVKCNTQPCAPYVKVTTGRCQSVSKEVCASIAKNFHPGWNKQLNSVTNSLGVFPEGCYVKNKGYLHFNINQDHRAAECSPRRVCLCGS